MSMINLATLQLHSPDPNGFDYPWNMTEIKRGSWVIQDTQQTVTVGRMLKLPDDEQYELYRTDWCQEANATRHTCVFSGTWTECKAYLIMCWEQLLEEI